MFWANFQGNTYDNLFSKLIGCDLGNLSSVENPVVIDLLKKSF